MKSFSFFVLFLVLALPVAQSATPLTDVKLSGTANQIVSGATLTFNSGATLSYSAGAGITGDLAELRSDLGLAIGTNVQAFDADLSTYAGITPSANVQTLLGSATYSAFKTSLGITSSDVSGIAGPVFNVKNYGAVLDGTTDDTTAVTNAIAAAVSAGGGTVYFSGMAKISSAIALSSSVGIRLLGGDRFTCGIKASAQTVGTLLNITGDKVTIENLKIDGSYTSGTGGTVFGLIKVDDAEDVTVRNCWITGSERNGILILGATKRLDIVDSRFTNNYCCIRSFPDTVNNETPEAITIARCQMLDGWHTGGNDQAGGIKLEGHGVTIESSGHRITDNYISHVGTLAIELWAGTGVLSNSTIANNAIFLTANGDEFGISLNACRYVKVIGNSIRMLEGAYIGIEVANEGEHNQIVGNSINAFKTDGTRTTGTTGIGINHNVDDPPKWTLIDANTITGAVVGLQVQDCPYTVISRNLVRDCETQILLQNTSHVSVQGNELIGPCSTHLFITAVNYDITNLDVAYNTFRGDASFRNVFGYNDSTSHTITNFRFHHNDATGATLSGYDGFALHFDSGEMTNVRSHDNYYLTTTGATTFPDYESADLAGVGDEPFEPDIQAYSIPVAKRFTFTVPSTAGDRWYKIFSLEQGLPLTLTLHVACNFLDTADNKASAQTFHISASPYGQAAGVMKLPDGNYNDGILKGIIYNNPSSGAVHEIWLRFPATTGGTVTVAGADYETAWIASPTAVTSAPSWATNHYELVANDAAAALKSRYIATDVLSGTALSSAPSAPAAGGYKLYPILNGSGKTELRVIFDTGAEQTVATEP